MARKQKKTKPLIYVFCEGESEQAYTDFLKHRFKDVAVIRRPPSVGLFEEAEARYKKDIKYLRRLRKNQEIRIRLLMTTGCIEYWLMLHFKMFAPSILTEAEKKRILTELTALEPAYEKGDYISTARIAEHYPVAVKNAEKTLYNLLQDGMPGLEDTDERNHWLCANCKTFSTVNEAISFLEELKNRNKSRKGEN